MSNKFTEKEMNEMVENHKLTEIEFLGLLKWIKEIEKECKQCYEKLHKLNQSAHVSVLDLEYSSCEFSIIDLVEKANSLQKYWVNCSFARK